MTTEDTPIIESVSPSGPVLRKRAKTEEPDPNERVTIILERTDKIPTHGLNIGHNGQNILVKPGIPVTIQRKYLQVLMDAIASDPVRDEEGNIVAFEDRSSYPFRYV